VRRLVVAGVLCALVAVPHASAETLPGFRSPSGNIRCFVTGGPVLLCQIHQANYAAALQQRCITRADVDWHGFQLGRRGRGTVTCTGGILYNPDSQHPSNKVLQYGRTWRSGPFTCSSHRAGVTCTTRSGHGIFVSRERWRAW